MTKSEIAIAILQSMIEKIQNNNFTTLSEALDKICNVEEGEVVAACDLKELGYVCGEESDVVQSSYKDLLLDTLNQSDIEKIRELEEKNRIHYYLFMELVELRKYITGLSNELQDLKDDFELLEKEVLVRKNNIE